MISPPSEPVGGSASPPVGWSWKALLVQPTGSILHQFARYLVAGGLAFVVDFGSLYLLTEYAGFHYLVSAAIAFIFGLLTNYLLSRLWVFDRRTMDSAAMEVIVFAAIGVVGLGLNEAIIWAVSEKLHLHYMLAKAVSSAVVLVWNFGARRAMLFSDRPMPAFLARLAPLFTTAALLSAAVATAFFGFCLAVQYLSGAWQADFSAYPDEPSHFVGAVMTRDWLMSGHWLSPAGFARDYYAHYPFFAVGYWPPLFSVVTGVWLMLCGVGRIQALMVPAAFAAGTGWLVFRFVRNRAGFLAGLCAGAIYLSLPASDEWMRAVMVDHVTAFLCVAVAALLLRYLDKPVLWNGIWVGLACACAILSKYSAAYTVALPFFAIVFLRRVTLLRKPSFLVQPLVVAFLVGPWALWTHTLATYGLPPERKAFSLSRISVFLAATTRIFPPILLAIVLLGVLALLCRPKAWRTDLIVLALLGAGHLGLLILSPVDAEIRYLLVPAAILLVFSFIGWSEIAKLLRWETPAAVAVSLLAVAFMASQFGHITRRISRDRIREVVGYIVNDPARAAQRVIVPPALEGPVIAEFAATSSHRPDHVLLRPSKILARSDWFGNRYSSPFSNPDEVMRYFQQHPVDLVIWTDRPHGTAKPHELLMGEMLQKYTLCWHKVFEVPPASDSASPWTIYEYIPAAR